MDEANAATSPSVIDFNLGSSPQTITLTEGQLALSNAAYSVTIEGPGASLLDVSGNNASRVFQIDQSVTASLSGLTISDASTTGNGGGVYNQGTTTITDCTITGNTSSGTDGGGGVYNKSGSHITLVDTTISGNIAATDVAGGLADFWHGDAHRVHDQR